MNVAELIERLQQFPPDMTVTVDGYEGGATEEFRLDPILVVPNGNEGRHYVGEHAELVLGLDEPIPDGPLLAVLNIGDHGEYTRAGWLCGIQGCAVAVPKDVAYCQPHADADAWKTEPLRPA